MTAPTGRVYDRGYRPFEGVVGGRSASVMALFRLTLRRALGLRRSWKQKILPWTLLGVAAVPAIVQVGVKYLTRDTPGEEFDLVTYREYVGHSTTLLLFVAVAAPDVICPDLRQRTLPLILSRPLTAFDYVAAKVGAMFVILFGFGFIPQLVLYVGQILVSDAALDYARHNVAVLWQVPLAVGAMALFYAMVSVAVASLTDRRLIAAAVFLVGILVSIAVSAVMVEVTGDLVATTEPMQIGFDYRSSIWGLVSIPDLPLYVRDLIFLGHVDPRSPLSGVSGGGALALVVYAVVVAAAATTLWLRYGAKEVR